MTPLLICLSTLLVMGVGDIPTSPSTQTDSIRVVQDLESAPRPEAVIRRAPGPIKIDGVLNDPAWRVAEAISEFFDSDPSGIISPTLERDPNTRDGDALEILFDTFLDRSSGFAFYVNPVGAVRECPARTSPSSTPDGSDSPLPATPFPSWEADG